MSDKILVLITEQGNRWPVSGRTRAVIEEIYHRRNEIEACHKGSIEIIINLKDRSVNATMTVRKVGEPRRIG